MKETIVTVLSVLRLYFASKDFREVEFANRFIPSQDLMLLIVTRPRLFAIFHKCLFK